MQKNLKTQIGIALSAFCFISQSQASSTSITEAQCEQAVLDIDHCFRDSTWTQAYCDGYSLMYVAACDVKVGAETMGGTLHTACSDQNKAHPPSDKSPHLDFLQFNPGSIQCIYKIKNPEIKGNWYDNQFILNI